MSLINQMLQDLDKRGANPARMDAAYMPVAAPTTKALRNKWRWMLGLMSTVLLSLVWLAWHQMAPAAKLAHRAPSPAVAALAPLVSTPHYTPATKPVLTEGAELAAISNLPVLLKLSSELDIRLVNVADVPEKSYAQASNAKPENGLPAKPVPQPILLKSAESAQPQTKLVKEATPHQQAEGEYRQATVLQQQGRIAEAVSTLEQALKFDAQHAAARQSLISLLLESKRYDEAMRYLQQGVALDQNQTGLAMILARLQVEKSNLPAAVETLQRSLPYASERADYLAFLAALLQREARHKESIDLYQKALKKMPQNPVWWMGLGISLQADARRPEALEAYQRAKLLTGLSPELLAFVEQKITQLQ